MKKLAGGITTLLVAFAMATPASSQALIGVGVIYGSDMDPFDIGFQAGVYVGMDAVLPGLRVGGDVEFYLPQSMDFFDESVDLNFMAFNANAQYLFLRGDFDAYGLAGVSFGRSSASANGDSDSHTDLGFNIGGGAEIPMGFGRLYGEVKFVTGDFDRIVAGLGVRFGI